MSHFVHEIAHGLSDIFDAIGNAIEEVFRTIGHVFAEIWHGIVSAIRSIWHFLTHNIVIDAIVLIVAAIVITIFAPELWSVIVYALENFEIELEAELIYAYNDMLAVWYYLSSSYIGVAAHYAYKALKVVNLVNHAATMYEDFKAGKWEAGITQLFNEVLPQITQDFDAKIQSLIDGTTHAFNTVNNDIGKVRTTVDTISGGLGQLQHDLLNIGHAFGVKQISEIGQGLGDFRSNVLARFESESARFQRDLYTTFFTAMNPLIHWDQQYHQILQGNAEAQNRLMGLVGWALPHYAPTGYQGQYSISTSGDLHRTTRQSWLAILEKLANR